QEQEYTHRRIQRHLQETQLDRRRREFTDSENNNVRKVRAAYANALSAKKLVQFRDKAVKEITRSYNQGRSDISILIEAINRYSNAEVDFSRAIGDYQISLNEWAALRDELIVDVKNTGSQKATSPNTDSPKTDSNKTDSQNKEKSP